MGRLLQYVKDDGNGNLVFSDFPDNSRSDGFNNIEDQFSSSMKWAVIGSVARRDLSIDTGGVKNGGRNLNLSIWPLMVCVRENVRGERE
ncbi:hypothetical protein L484_016760 [Morus notabilis]|uniref:Uncharacterized protein n=1 Tax=Morus notabilis TaxID=981085 RepID=W9RI17_9ROSA|nr:hypothetical protein L484_016760 [Morus notabilis]